MKTQISPTIPALLLTMCLFLVAAAGCSDDSDPTGPGSSGQSVSAQDGVLQLKVTTDKASYAHGESVTVTVTLTNTGNASVDLDFNRGRPARYSNLVINVDDSDGLGHFIDGEGEFDTTTLAPNGSYRYSFVWNQVSRLTRQPVERGFFEVIGFAAFDDRDTIRASDLFIELK